MRRELYLSILMDRTSGGPLLVASPFGGTSIEDVAASNPDAIFTLPIPITETAIPEETSAKMASNLGFEPGQEGYDKIQTLMKNLYKMFLDLDCTQAELNPVAETPEGDVVVCDAKVNFDGNAEFRQSEVRAYEEVF